MGITKCNTMVAIWRLRLQCGDDFSGRKMSSNSLNQHENFYLLSTNDI